jgi:hypothetical protein
MVGGKCTNVSSPTTSFEKSSKNSFEDSTSTLVVSFLKNKE